MNRTTSNRIFVSVLVAFFCGSMLLDAYVRWKRTGPDIVVYLDKDAKQPAILPVPETLVVSGERAALWWSVYNKSQERGHGSDTSRYTANDAVEVVYGKVR